MTRHQLATLETEANGAVNQGWFKKRKRGYVLLASTNPPATRTPLRGKPTRLRLLAVTIAALSLSLGPAAGAIAVRSGKSVTIQAAPWAVDVLAGGQQECSGVIADARHVITAGHCLFEEPSGKAIPTSLLTVEAGRTSIHRPLASDTPEVRAVSAVRLMSGYVPENKITAANQVHAAAVDLAELTLSTPFRFDPRTVQAVRLPMPNARPPSLKTPVIAAGFGENPNRKEDGVLGEVRNPKVSECIGNGALCVWSRSGVCPGDSGLGLVETKPHVTLIGILSAGWCLANQRSLYTYLGSPSVMRFVHG